MKEINCAVRPPAWWLRHMGASRPVGVQAPIPHPFSNEGRAKVAHSKKKFNCYVAKVNSALSMEFVAKPICICA
jgi:hypothetical protein